MKTYVLTISRNFPTTHSMKGQPTEFHQKIIDKAKKHTIRANYTLWKKRIDEVNAGLAIISLRQWSAKPYCSPQQELMQFKAGEINVQMIINGVHGFYTDEFMDIIPTYVLAENDGLTETNFKEWFKKAKKEDELAIIHFTDFRY